MDMSAECPCGLRFPPSELPSKKNIRENNDEIQATR